MQCSRANGKVLVMLEVVENFWPIPFFLIALGLGAYLGYTWKRRWPYILVAFGALLIALAAIFVSPTNPPDWLMYPEVLLLFLSVTAIAASFAGFLAWALAALLRSPGWRL